MRGLFAAHLSRCFSSGPSGLAVEKPTQAVRLAARDARKAQSRQAALDAQTTSLPSFSEMIALRGLPPLTRGPVTTVMVNIGKLCNLACRHCHVESSPLRTSENMSKLTVDRILYLLERSPSVHTLDITGGAPELNPHFRALVEGATRGLHRQVNSRCNLTVLNLPKQADTPAFLAAHRVRVIASLPSTDPPTLERQRGQGVWEGSIAGLKALNAVGYGGSDPGLPLDLIYNPAGARLPPPQEALELEFKAALRDTHGITFHRLLTLTNMPIKRFSDDLVKSGEYEAYMGLLGSNFNPLNVPEVMCRSTISVGWDGTLWDCDFNQALGVPFGADPKATLWNIDSFGGTGGTGFEGTGVATTKACYGCTAADGSSCGGALKKA